MITIEFKDLAEMKAFAKELLAGEKLDMPVPAAVAVAPPAAPVQTVPAVQTVPTAQIAPTVQTAPKMPAVQTSPAPAAVVPTSAITYTQDDLARAATQVMDAGGQSQLIGLLSQFGVISLPELPPEQYGAFATALRGLGAQI